MAAILFLAAFILAIVHWSGGTWFDPHYLDAEFSLIGLGLFCMTMGWGGFPVAFVRRNSPA
jgi:hypothetical protein